MDTTMAAAFLTATGLAIVLGPAVIARLRTLGARQTVSADAPERHAAKQGTPTMGGLLILVALTIPMLAHAVLQPAHRSILGLLGLTLGFGAIGFVDDLLIARRGKNLGLLARQKLALQFLVAIAFAAWFRGSHLVERATVVRLGPAFEIDFGARLGSIDGGLLYWALAVILIVGLSNAVNLADGLDGLAGGMAAMIAMALAGSVYAAGYLEWLPAFAAALAGACAGFLWFNAHPAEVFMGDTGSLALGAALAGIAIVGKAEGPLLAASIVPILEALSVMAQVAVFRVRKSRRGIEYARAHRLFRRTPIHHHFEEIGWPETKIVWRFWLATAAAVAAACMAFGPPGPR